MHATISPKGEGLTYTYDALGNVLTGNSVMAVIANGYIEPTEGLWAFPCGSFGVGETKKGG